MANPEAGEKLRRVDRRYDRLPWQVKGLYALTILSLLLAACQRAGITPRAPGVTEAIPTPPAEVIPVPVEIPPTAVVAPATSTEAVLSGGGNPPLCDPLLAPFIPGRIVDKKEWTQWVGPDGKPVSVNSLLETMRSLGGAEELNVWAVGADETFRWGAEGRDKNGHFLWTGTEDDPYLDRPDRILVDEHNQPIVELNPLPDPEIGEEIVIGASGDRVTVRVVGAETEGVKLCFDSVVNGWIAVAAAETPRPADTSTPALSTPRSGVDPLGELLTERASYRNTLEPPPPTPTEKPTAVVRPSPEPTPEPSLTPTPEQPRPTWIPPGVSFIEIGDNHWATSGVLFDDPCPDVSQDLTAERWWEYDPEHPEWPWGKTTYACAGNWNRVTIKFVDHLALPPSP